jgi:hypothetical protein
LKEYGKIYLLLIKIKCKKLASDLPLGGPHLQVRHGWYYPIKSRESAFISRHFT